MKTYIIGPFLAFLPERWRKTYFGGLRVDWAKATVLSGLLEGLVALTALVVWYSIFVTRLAGIIAGRGGFLSGYVGLFSLTMHPLTWVICYFGCEGAVRFLAGLVSYESYGTLPLWLISWAVRKTKARSRKEPLVDEVILGAEGYDLQIRSCRPKDNWIYPLAIRYQDEFFQITGKERKPLSEPRPYVYFLQRLPPNEIIKGLEPYDPTSVLAEESVPGFFETVFSEIHRRSCPRLYKTKDRN